MAEELPGFIPRVLQRGDVSLLRADEAVLTAMVDGWRAQMLARGLATSTITARCSLIGRFVEFTNEYPWRWRPLDLDQFLADLRSRETPIELSTLRSYSNAISMFCSYVSDSRYGWVPFCEKQFGDVPSQICFEWNTPRHSTDDAVPTKRRAFTKTELQHFFDVVDDFVDEQHRAGSKRWLTALRDSIAFKVGYAYGLRRRELVMLDLTDFGPNPHVPRYGDYGAMTVRWAKGTTGSGPRRRTVLTVPEFPWAVELLQYWCTEGRQLLRTADRSPALWPSERGSRLTINALGRSFTALRARAGLPPELKLHCLRHSYTTHLLEAGYDPLFVQQQLGHSYASTTALYTSVGSDFKQRVVQQMIARRLRMEEADG
ncbi:tyrosine-type recombinase/integrase [Mycolicibacterium gilvum]|nr:tyrosine-type recombinase/integrase [Mycolicibacterium gilvum]